MKKQGVSLMVLILTVIIMVILAGTVIISLNNSGVINRAQGTVDEYNLNQVEELANLAWGEAYLAGNTTQTKLKEYVLNYLTKNEVDTTKYYIEVTTKGVTVKDYENYIENGWYRAWTCTNRVWSDELNPGESLNGEVVAKLYTTDEENKYDLIISGKGEMGVVTGWGESEFDGITSEVQSIAYLKSYRDKIRNVFVEEGITNIGIGAFFKCSLENIVLSESVVKIENGAFTLASDLKEIHIPKSVSYIDFEEFDDEGGMKRKPFANGVNITIDDNNQTYKIENNVIYSKDGTTVYYTL